MLQYFLLASILLRPMCQARCQAFFCALSHLIFVATPEVGPVTAPFRGPRTYPLRYTASLLLFTPDKEFLGTPTSQQL